jgi:dynein light chain LC8-type
MSEDKIRFTDMHDPSEMRSDALAQAQLAVQKFAEEKEIARHLKTHFDAKFSPNWHCVVGKSFANYTSYEAKHHIFFEVPPLFVLLYKFG